jgi:hypothetical protein
VDSSKNTRLGTWHLIKVGAAHVHAGGGQHVTAAVLPPAALGGEPHDGEIRRAAADVHHQHHRLVRDALLVVQRGGDGLQLERHFGKPGIQRRLAQRLLRLLVTIGIPVHEVHRAPHHHPARHAAQPVACLLRQHAQEEADDVLVTHQLVVHRRLVLKQRTAQQAFERAHQTPFGPLQVLRHRIAPEVGCVVLRVEEQRRRQRRCRPLERHHARRPASHAHCHGRVGRAEVDAQGGVLQGGGHGGDEQTKNE